ncbi:MAG: GPW/gp25 family protein [Methanosarcinaceae archaeon]
MAKDFLGRGWKFPVNLNPKGEFEMSAYEVDVGEAIRIILGTAKGERVMHPDFGCGIHDYVFEIINTSTIGMIEASVREALVSWEPRIEINNVEVKADTEVEGKLLVNVDYVVRSTNNEFNLVYPFYLKEGRLA